MATANVAFIRQDLANKFPNYDLIAHCLGGSEAIKAQLDKYLPRPDAANVSLENRARFDAYIKRAVFYNITKRTEAGLLGQVFKRAPVIKHPAALENVVTDSNGGGIGLVQLAKDATAHALDYGRLGVFIDYPPTSADRPVTKADLDSGHVRPTISVYGPKDVINWRSKKIGSKYVLSLVVLKEIYEVEDDGFETKIATQYRELRLDDADTYSVQLWRPKNNDANGTEFERFGPSYRPTGGDGVPLMEIPFTFVGSKNNEPSIDPEPLIDLANINVAHFCNSADYEESVYLIGQPMLIVAGLTSEWYTTHLGSKIPFGSRSGLALNEGATAELLQAEPNTLAKEAMEHKERQMVALGAKIVEQKQVQRTATEATQENNAEESTLVSIANNVSAAMQWALEWCAYFVNAPETGIEFKLNTDFDIARMSATDQAAVVKLWQDSAITWEEMRAVLHQTGIATEDDEIAKTANEAEAAKALAAAVDETAQTAQTAQALADATPPNVGS